MRRPMAFLTLAAACLVSWQGAALAVAQERDLVAAVQQATRELAAADTAVVAARNALQNARDSLDTNRFNSAAYNARVTAQQVQAAKEKYEQAGLEQKEEALEVYQLAQELAEQRKAALEAAEKLLPQREKEAKAAEGKYATALAAAEQLAGQIKSLVRETESDALARLKEAKEATEAAALARATAEQASATGEQILKALAVLKEADQAFLQAAAAWQEASDEERPQKLNEAQRAIQGYAAALQTAAAHLALPADEAAQVTLKVTQALVEADRAAKRATAALEQAQQDLENRLKAVEQANTRVKSAQEAVETRVAKIRAEKDLEREKQAAQRAEAAKREAETTLPAMEAEAERTGQQYAAALEAAVQRLLQTPENEGSLEAARRAIAKAIAGTEAEIAKRNETLSSDAAETQKLAEQAQAALDAADKLVAQRAKVREDLQQILRRRFYREASTAVNQQRQTEAELASANRELQTKTTALTRATTDLKQLQENMAKAQEEAAAQVARAAQAKEAAAKTAEEKAAARVAAEREAQEKEAAAKEAARKTQEAEEAARVAEAALETAIEELNATEKRAQAARQAAKDLEQKAATAQTALKQAAAEKQQAEEAVNQRRQTLEAIPARIAAAKAAAYGGLKPLDDSAWDYDKARHLLVRAGFGGTPDEVARLHALGLHGAVRHLVYFTGQPPPDIPFVAHPRPRPENYESALSGEEQRRLRNERVARDRQQIQNMRVWWLRRMIETPRPLEEKLTLFWHGQIPAQYSDVGDSYHMYLQNQLFRDHGAGDFSALLYGIAHDAAMLKYLNNDTNVKGRANENLAREIMELFSMGRDQGYSETDIRQGARALTGYTYDPWTGQFRFISQRHDTDPKTIFGKDGNWNGDDFVRLILETPYPARFIARQMFIFFAHDAPSVDTVEALANVLRLNDYQLTAMLENLFLSQEFYSERAMGTQVKGPVQLVVGLHRELGLKDADLAYLVSAVREMGQDLFEPPSVFGWQGGETWVTTSRSFIRYNALAETLERRPRAGKTGVDVVGTVLAGKKFEDHAKVVDHLITCCLNGPLSETKRQALVEFLEPLPPPAKWEANANAVNARLTRLLVMLACSPEYQLF